MKDTLAFAGRGLSLILLVTGIFGSFGLIGGVLTRQQPNLRFLVPPTDQVMANLHDADYRNNFLQLRSISSYDYSRGSSQKFDELNRYIERHADFTEGYLARGLIYFSLGHYGAGVTDMKRVIAKTDDPAMRKRASREIWLAYFAQILIPVVYLGTAGFAALQMMAWLEIKLYELIRVQKPALAIASAIWLVSLGFFVFYHGFVE